MTIRGYSQRTPPLGTGTSLADINSDIAFKGNLAFQGHWSGFRVIDVTDPDEPDPALQHRGLRQRRPGRRGRLRQPPGALVGLVELDGANANATCMGDPVGTGFEGIHICDIADPANPVKVRKLRMAATGNDAGAPAVGCGAHTATAVPDDARGHLYIYNGGSSGTCTGIDIVRISLSEPDRRDVPAPRAHGRAVAQCHDNNVL